METEKLRQRNKYILLTMDGFSGHASVDALCLFKENYIIVVALPAHTTHRFQALDYSIFSPFNNALSKSMNEKLLRTGGDMRNDVYTLCEIVHTSYNDSLTYKNVTSGFHGCSLWSSRTGRVNTAVIKESDIRNREGEQDSAAA